MRVFLFDGQGSSPSSTAAVQQPRTPLATLFAHQTNAAFVSRVSTLEPATRDALNTCATRTLLSQLRNGSIILPTSDVSLLRHPLISIPSLYVSQVTRLLEELESNGLVGEDESVRIVGFSSGILPAILVATSFPPPSLCHSTLSASAQISILRVALALFEMAMSIGIEAQVSKEAMFSASKIALDDPARDREWSAIVFGEQRDILEVRIAAWNSQRKDTLSRVHLTAQTTATCHTLSALPSVLREFLDSRPLPHTSPFLSDFATASQTSLLSTTSTLSSDASVTSEPNSLSRKSSASSFSASSISSCASQLQNSVDLPDTTQPLSLLNDLKDLSARLSPNSPLASRSKPFEIYTLFHADVPLLRVARDRVLHSVFPSFQSEKCALSSEGTSDTPTYINLHPNKVHRSTDMDDETRFSLSTLRIGQGFILYDSRTGCEIPSTVTGIELIERVLDSIFIDRVELAAISENLMDTFGSEMKMEFVNFGPGSGLARTAMRSLKERIPATVILNDLSVAPSVTIPPVTLPSLIDPRQEPIAIVGMAVNLPGARDTSELWRVLEHGINTVQEIPQTRFSISPYLEENTCVNAGRQLKTRFGNFLPDGLHASFDNAFFRISPREARALDPQIRIVMRVGMQAMESAGLLIQDSAESRDEIERGSVRSEDVGCFVGAATNDYVHNLRNDVGVHYATGTLPAFLAGRLAYALHLSGPSVVLDTACSSSLVAIHQACRALLAGDCKAALAGGVNVISSPDTYLGLDRAHFLSPTGNCKPWDESADGYCRAEGCGMFVLKRLSDAVASSDNILGVIRGTEVNQSSSAVSITRPHGPTQANLFRALLDKSGVRPEDVGLVEAHGTGTQAGDPEELKSLREVLSPQQGYIRSQRNPLTVTSIKGNIGHAEAASGAASLAKVLIMLRNRSIPTQVGLVRLNPNIEPLEKDYTRINTSGKCIDWMPNPSGRRIALVNNFGAAGSNAAIVVEEAPIHIPASPSVCRQGSIDHVFVGISAETEQALLRLRDAYISALTNSNLVDFCYTATARRKVRPWRISASSDSADGLAKALSQARPTNHSDKSGAKNKKIVFVFSGQGGQHAGMGFQLYKVSQTFRTIVDSCHEKLVSWGYPGVLSIVEQKGGSTLSVEEELVAFQCAMFVLECALFSLWESWGIRPDAVVGHSLGEYAALVAARVFSLDTGLRLVARRAQLMTKRCQQGVSGMLMVRQPAQVVFDVIKALGGCEGLSIACHNGPNDVVIGGPLEQIRTLKEHLERAGTYYIDVNVPFAYHTSAMNPVLDELAVFAHKFDFGAPMIPVVSNVAGKVVFPGDATVFNSMYLARHCRQAVQFEEGLHDLIDVFGSVDAFVEIGPHPTSLPMLANVVRTAGAISLPSLHKKMSAYVSLCSAFSRMFVLRDNIAWDRVYRELFPAAGCTDIPGYPLVETEFWVPYVEGLPFASASQSINTLKRFSFLTTWTHQPSSKDGNISEFETPIEHLAEYISGHKVASSPLCPASIYYELALSAATCTLEHGDESFSDALTLSEVQFTVPLVYDSAKPVVIRTSINIHPEGGKHAGTFSITSVLDGKEQSVHCTGFFQCRQMERMISKLQLHCGDVERARASLFNHEDGIDRETLRSRTIYELIFSRVVQYSKLFQVISAMTLDDRKGEGFATFRLSSKEANKAFIAQPVFVDALLHAAGFLINSRAAGSEAFICNQVDSSKMLLNIDHSATFEVYCTTTHAGEGLMLADAWAIESGGSRRIVAHMKRMRFSRVRLNSLSRLLSRQEDVPSRNASPAPLVRPSFENYSSPATPYTLGSPFRPSYRAVTPSSMTVSSISQTAPGCSAEVIAILSETCAIPALDITLDSNIADLGVDSLIWIELFGQFSSMVPSLSADLSELMLSTTVWDLVKKLEGMHVVPKFDMENYGAHTPSSKPVSQITARPDIASDSVVQEVHSISYIVKGIIGTVLDVPPENLHDDDSLDELGLDSLGSIEVMAQFREQFQITLPHDFFGDFTVIGSVQSFIADMVDQRSHSRQSSSSTLVNNEPVQNLVGLERMLLPLQRKEGTISPLFLVHDGSGLSHCYSRISNIGRSVWGISNPKLLSGERWEGGIAEMSSHYIDQIKPMMTDTGCILGGWSFGGVVAFHMACELMRGGTKIAGVVLIDSPSPFTQNCLSEALIKSVIPVPTSSPTRKRQAQIMQLARTQMSHSTRALVSYEPLEVSAESDVPAYPNVVMLRCTDAFPLTESRTSDPFLENRSDANTFVRDWERLIGRKVPIFDIPGHHFEPFSPANVPALSLQLKRAIAHLEAV